MIKADILLYGGRQKKITMYYHEQKRAKNSTFVRIIYFVNCDYLARSIEAR